MIRPATAGPSGRRRHLVVAGRTARPIRTGRSRLVDWGDDGLRRRGGSGGRVRGRSGGRMRRGSGGRVRGRSGGRLRSGRLGRRDDGHDRAGVGWTGGRRRHGRGLDRRGDRRRRGFATRGGRHARGRGCRRRRGRGREGRDRWSGAPEGDPVGWAGRCHDPGSQRDGRETEVEKPHGDDQTGALSGGHDVQQAPCVRSGVRPADARNGSTQAWFPVRAGPTRATFRAARGNPADSAEGRHGALSRESPWRARRSAPVPSR